MLAEAGSSAFAKATANTRSFSGGVPRGEAARINAASARASERRARMRAITGRARAGVGESEGRRGSDQRRERARERSHAPG